MSDKLVVYYSRSGSTRNVAEKLAEYLDCDIAEIVSKKKYRGPFGFIAGGRAAMRESMTEITEPESAPENYETVIVCTPVWASNIAPPVRAYLSNHKGKFKKISYLVTLGGSGYENTINKMTDLAGDPVKTIHFSNSEFKSNAWVEKLKNFSDEL